MKVTAKKQKLMSKKNRQFQYVAQSYVESFLKIIFVLEITALKI